MGGLTLTDPPACFSLPSAGDYRHGSLHLIDRRFHPLPLYTKNCLMSPRLPLRARGAEDDFELLILLPHHPEFWD